MKSHLKTLLVLAIGLGVFFWLRGGSVSSERAHELVSQGAKLVDVRTPEEFASGHIAGAINIPVSQIEARAHELGAKEGPLVVYCHAGVRSRRAADILERAGFKLVHDLGAMSRW
ncbi:MAG: rhodanese-like domain-containing protein [Myxococcaceae bacterium]